MDSGATQLVGGKFLLPSRHCVMTSFPPPLEGRSKRREPQTFAQGVRHARRDALNGPGQHPHSELESGQREFIARLKAEDLARPLAYFNTQGERWEYPLWHILLHVVNHSTYHRGQVATMLRQLGAEPAATDFLLFQDLAAHA